MLHLKYLALFIITITGAAMLFIASNHKKEIVPQPTPASQEKHTISIVPPLTKKYTNAKFHFSVMMPEDFEAQELVADENGTVSVMLQDSLGTGIQILVSPQPSSQKTLSADDIRSSIPDMTVSEDQPVEIGNDYRGVAFRSNNEAFGGNSRDVWFIFKGNLYQISTYARLDPLLKSMFGTWQFF